MKTPADVIIALESTTKRLEKELIIKQAWDSGIYHFFDGAKLAYDAFITFGVKKVPLIEDADEDDFVSTFDWARFKKIATQLETRALTGNAARDTLRAAANESDAKEWNHFYRRVLLKDLKCGITESTINKVLEKIDTQKSKSYIIDVFSCQLAKNGEDHPKKMEGIKLLDPKLDGVRILTIFDINKKTVTQHSRNGHINENFPQITTALEKLLPVLKTSMVFDGEMVSKNFQFLMKQLNRKTNVDTSDAKLALFDCLPLDDFIKGECKITQTARHEALVEFQSVFDKIAPNMVYVIPKLAVDLNTPEGQEKFKEFNKEVLEAGYEGLMAKDPLASYRTKRTDAWMKFKPFITVDLEVIAVEPGKPDGKFAHTMGGLLCKGVDNDKLIEVSVGGGYTEELRDEIWKNQDKIIGRIVEVKGDVLTKSDDKDTWSLRFPEFLQFRGWNIGEKN